MRSEHNFPLIFHCKNSTRHDTIHTFHHRSMSKNDKFVHTSSGYYKLFQAVCFLAYYLMPVHSYCLPIQLIFSVQTFLMAGLPVMTAELPDAENIILTGNCNNFC